MEEKENFLMGLLCVIVRILGEKGVNNAAAVKIGMDIIKAVSHSFGGNACYIGKGHALFCKERVTAIIEEFTGANYSELALKYGVSERQLRKVVKEKQGFNLSGAIQKRRERKRVKS